MVNFFHESQSVLIATYRLLIARTDIQQAMVLLHCTYMFKLVIGASRTSLVRFTSMGPGSAVGENGKNGLKRHKKLASERASKRA